MVSILIIFIALLQSTFCTIGVSFDLFSHPDTKTYECFLAKGFTNNAILVYQFEKGISPAYAQNLRTLKSMGLNTTLIFSPCRSNDPIASVDKFTSSIPSELFDKIFIYTYNIEQYHPSCSWDTNSQYSNCRYIQSLVSEFSKRNISVGIGVDRYDWQNQFAKYCEKVSELPLLWAANFDEKALSKNKFQPFSKFKKPNKILLKNQNICKIVVNKIYSY